MHGGRVVAVWITQGLKESEDVSLAFLKIEHTRTSSVEKLWISLTSEELLMQIVQLSWLPACEVIMGM